MDPKDFIKRLREFLESKNFSSLEEINWTIKEFIEMENNTPLEKFCGLSPYKMWRLVNFPFDSPDVISFNTNALPPLDAPFVKLFILLIKGIHDAKGLKATVAGNLPRDFCRELERTYLPEEDLKFFSRDKFPIIREQDFPDLHRVRVVAEMAGYIRKYKKRFVLTERGRKLVERSFTIDNYSHLFKTFALKYNWAYFDFFDEIDIIQDSFLFTLYLLQIFGNEFRSKEFYANKFSAAFSLILKSIPPDSRFDTSTEKEIKNAYIHRAINLFAIAWGFAKTEKNLPYSGRFSENVRKTNFLDEFIKLA